ncbi:MAG: radical SAM protein [Thermodesulfobacteriota bacterium]
MSKKRLRPHLLVADAEGQIYDHPDLLMLVRRGHELTLPRPDELIGLPPGSDVFLLPGRRALGFNQHTGEIEALEEHPVAAFACPGYTLSAHAAYQTEQNAPVLPLFAYGAVGYAQGRFWVCAQNVDTDRRQQFEHIAQKRIDAGAHRLLRKFPENRLIHHLSKCALTYCCPAAKNLALGRFEAPIPTAQSCNARCHGCISAQETDSGFPATQQRIAFRPTVREITELMHEHARREKQPIFSFGQGCEGEPLTEAARITEAITAYRDAGGTGTININTNASLPGTIPALATAGLTSIRVSLNSMRRETYERYFRPQGYSFEDVLQSIRAAKDHGLFVSLNYLFFPGIGDTEEEFAALAEKINTLEIDCIQMRNLNLDPEYYLSLCPEPNSPIMGLPHFLKRLKATCPAVHIGYFNPFIAESPQP